MNRYERKPVGYGREKYMNIKEKEIVFFIQRSEKKSSVEIMGSDPHLH